MTKFLTNRVILVVVFIGICWLNQYYFQIDDLDNLLYYIALWVGISLIIFFPFLIKAWSNPFSKLKLNWMVDNSFIITIVFGIGYFFVIKFTTFVFHDGLDQNYRYIKGYKLATNVNSGIENMSDESLFLKFSMGSLELKHKTWDSDSIIINEVIISIVLILFMIFLSIAISYGSRLLQFKKPDMKDEEIKRESPIQTSVLQNKVFLSYNHMDRKIAIRLKKRLQSSNITVLFDCESMKTGESIIEFIQKCIRESDVTVCIVSKNSLLSAWVAMETIYSMTEEKIRGRRFFPVNIDDNFFDRQFVDNSERLIDTELTQIEELIRDRLSRKMGISDLEDEQRRYLRLKNELANVVRQLRNVLCTDLSQKNFDKGIKKVINDIRAKT